MDPRSVSTEFFDIIILKNFVNLDKSIELPVDRYHLYSLCTEKISKEKIYGCLGSIIESLRFQEEPSQGKETIIKTKTVKLRGNHNFERRFIQIIASLISEVFNHLIRLQKLSQEQ